MKKRLLILAVVLAAIALPVLFVLQRKPAAAPTTPLDVATPAEIAQIVAHEESVFPVLGPEQPEGEPAPEAPRTERYLPPPSMDLTGGKLGGQRVPGAEGIGDVYQLYFRNSDFALYMAVIEPDDLRSVWRLDQHGKLERVFAINRNPGEVRLYGTSGGVMYVQSDNPIGMVRTDDAFKSWHDVQGSFGMFWQMADDGKGTVWGTLHDYNRAILYRSPDNGFSWEPWVDFQKVFPEDAVTYADGDDRFRLRHLHGIIYNDKTDELIVGTGDVARYALSSRDGGVTWKKIWHEGFTAWAPMSGGSRYLLGPDKLSGPGIAIYDAWAGTVRETWRPADHDYAGYTYSIVNVDGIYYAGFHTEANEVADRKPLFGIVVSPDGETWYPFLQWGPLGNHARTDIWLASSPGAAYASVNGALYAFRPLERSWFEGQLPFPQR
jgi:hypothetical protein